MLWYFGMMLLMNMSQTYFNLGYVPIAQVYVLSWCVFVSNSDCTFSINSLYTNVFFLLVRYYKLGLVYCSYLWVF